MCSGVFKNEVVVEFEWVLFPLDTDCALAISSEEGVEHLISSGIIDLEADWVIAYVCFLYRWL